MNRKALYSFLIAFILLIAVTIIYRKSFSTMQDYTIRVDQSHRVINLLEELSNNFKSAQIYSEKFAPAEKDFYQLYKEQANRIRTGIIELKELTKSNPEQNRRMDTVTGIINEQLDTLMKYNIVELIQVGQGDRLRKLYEVHTLINRGIESEQKLLQAQKIELESSTTETAWLTFGFTIIAVSLILITFFSNVFNVRKRRWLEGFLESVLNTSQNGIVSYKAIREKGKIVDFKIEFVNKGLEKLLELKTEDVIGKRLSEIPSYIRNSGIYEKYVEVVETGRQLSFETLYTRGNVQRWMYALLAKREDGLTVSFHDISPLKKYEEDLKENIRKLESSNAELEQYAYAASHDLQEPLRKIRIYTSHLQDKQNDRIGEGGRQDIERILNAAERMSVLISDLLAFSSIKKESGYTETDLNQVLKNVMEDLELVIQQKQAIIENGILPKLEAIPLQMNQLFYNLLNNALKFSRSDASPRIRIEARQLKAEEVRANEALLPNQTYYEIAFIDNGLGFDNTYAEQIFVIFKRLTDKQMFPGSGIGLALCRKVVENHNGFIYATGEENKGATFYVLLPQQQPGEAPDPATRGN